MPGFWSCAPSPELCHVFPSWWQGIRLHWIFRHFRVLSPQVLSRRDRRLIEKLARSAVVTPDLPVSSKAVFGVVEKAGSKPPASANKREASGGRNLRLLQWGALGFLLAFCVTMTVAWLYESSPSTNTAPIKKVSAAQAATNSSQAPNLHPAVNSPVRVSASAAPSPDAAKAVRRVTPPLPEAAPAPRKLAAMAGEAIKSMPADNSAAMVPGPAPLVSSSSPRRLFVPELPLGRFAYPVVSEPDLVGELRLLALIGADGSVKEVSVLSGNPKLADAGIRAVRQWRFSPYVALGSPVEVETEIKMNFFGKDAVSIASVTHRSNSAVN